MHTLQFAYSQVKGRYTDGRDIANLCDNHDQTRVRDIS